MRSPDEILATLDSNGALDGIPFMPEMLEWCGKPVEVSRRVEKACVGGCAPIYPNRRFANRDVVTLEMPRCNGSGHDDCHRRCRIFWKEAWLRPAAEQQTSPPVDLAALARLRDRLKIRHDATRYYCQSTEMLKSTEEFPGNKKLWLMRVALREIVNDDLPALIVAWKFVRWCRMLLWRRLFDTRTLRGPNQKTPSTSLTLQPGEWVRIKSRAEIAATLDPNGKNRGMNICEEMTQCCGKEAEVRMRVEQIIDEKTGIMHRLTDTVMIQNLSGDPQACERCMCYGEIGDCPRDDLMFWREVWLERTGTQKPTL